MWHLGFSYVGLIYLVMLFVPNIIWSKFKPEGYDEIAKDERKLFGILETVGQVLVCPLVLMFSDFNINEISWWSITLLISFLLMVLYEIYWIRYFASKKTLADMYSSIIGIPVAGATLPVFAFMLLAVYGKNPFLGLAVLILGIGHIGIHLEHKMSLK